MSPGIKWVVTVNKPVTLMTGYSTQIHTAMSYWIQMEYVNLFACARGDIHPGRFEPTLPMELTSSQIEALLA